MITSEFVAPSKTPSLRSNPRPFCGSSALEARYFAVILCGKVNYALENPLSSRYKIRQDLPKIQTSLTTTTRRISMSEAGVCQMNSPLLPVTQAAVRHDAADHAAELVAVAGLGGGDERVVHGRVAVRDDALVGVGGEHARHGPGAKTILADLEPFGADYLCAPRHAVVRLGRWLPLPFLPQAEVRHDAADHAAELVAVAGEAGGDERVVHGRVAVQDECSSGLVVNMHATMRRVGPFASGK